MNNNITSQFQDEKDFWVPLWFTTVDGKTIGNCPASNLLHHGINEAEITSAMKIHECHADRKNDYPSIEDQLDELYHNGIEGWKATIKAVKDAHPKPTGE